MVNAEELKRYFWYFFGVLGVVFFWTGVWDGIGKLPYLSQPLISLAIGSVLLLLRRRVFIESEASKSEQSAHAILNHVRRHPQKQEFHIKYHDKLKKKDLLLKADAFKKIEKGFAIFTSKAGEEVFVPMHRIREVLHKGKTFWKY